MTEKSKVTGIGETKYIAKQAVRDRNIITANGTAPMEFAKEILSALNVASEDKMQDMFINGVNLEFYEEKRI